MTEKEIKIKFIEDHLDGFKKLVGLDNIRLYMMEFPVRTPDGTKKIDILLESEVGRKPDNPLLVLEFKKDPIDIGVCEQVLRYSEYVKMQLYRKKRATPFILGPDFSKWELKIAKDNNVFCIQYLNDDMKLVK